MAKIKKPELGIWWTLKDDKDGCCNFNADFLITGSFPVCFTKLFGEQLRHEIDVCVSDFVSTYLGEHTDVRICKSNSDCVGQFLENFDKEV